MEIARKLPSNLPKVLQQAIQFTDSLINKPENHGLVYLTKRHVNWEDERQTRLERRQAQSLVLAAILSRTDLATMRIRVTMRQLAKDAGLYNEETGYHQRSSRALHDLIAAGWVFMEKTRVLADGVWSTFTQMRLNKGAFTILGGEKFGNWAQHEIRRAKGRAKAILDEGKKSLKEFFRGRADRLVDEAFSAALSKIKPSKLSSKKAPKPSPEPSPAKQPRHQSINQNRDMARLIIEMKEQGMSDKQIITAFKTSPPAPA